MSQVTIAGHSDCCVSRFEGYTIIVRNTNNIDNPSNVVCVDNQPALARVGISVDNICQQTLTGSYLHVLLHLSTSTNDMPLILCEVFVYVTFCVACSPGKYKQNTGLIA